MNKEFTINDTNFSKGVAMCLMILHHLFWNVTAMGVSIYYMAISQEIGILGKVCVSIFLLLSGYGLDKSVKNDYKIGEFYKRHLSKIYFNYWFIVIVSFIIGAIFFTDKARALIGDNAFYKVILNFTGLYYLTGYMGYNSSWWFITAIIVLYLLFPLIRILVKQYNHVFLIFSSILLFPELIPFDVLNVKWVAFNFFPFILGVYLAESKVLENIQLTDERAIYKFTRFTMIALAFVFIIPIRLRLGMTFDGYRLDILFGLLIIFINYLYLSRIKIMGKFFSYIGIYSMDMYLIHGFITTLYTPEFIYGLKNPVVMFLVVLLLSLFISVLFSKVKTTLKINYNNLRKALDSTPLTG
jgi:hypothetical protein